jgi:proteic killer suppression protein
VVLADHLEAGLKGLVEAGRPPISIQSGVEHFTQPVQDDGVIENFKHKGLAQFFKDDDRRKLPASQIAKIGRILARLNEAITLEDMGLPGYRLHPLKGEMAGFWSVTLSGNWRIIFRFEGGHAYDVELIDYH